MSAGPDQRDRPRRTPRVPLSVPARGVCGSGRRAAAFVDTTALDRSDPGSYLLLWRNEHSEAWLNTWWETRDTGDHDHQGSCVGVHVMEGRPGRRGTNGPGPRGCVRGRRGRPVCGCARRGGRSGGPADDRVEDLVALGGERTDISTSPSRSSVGHRARRVSSSSTQSPPRSPAAVRPGSRRVVRGAAAGRGEGGGGGGRRLPLGRSRGADPAAEDVSSRLSVCA